MLVISSCVSVYQIFTGIQSNYPEHSFQDFLQ